MLGQVLVNLLDQLDVMRPVGIQPKDRRRTSDPSPIDSQLDPVSDRRVFRLAHPEDIVFLDQLLHQGIARIVHHSDGSVTGRFKSLVVRPIFFCLLGHQPDVGDAANRSRVERPLFLAIFDYRLI